MSIGFVIVDQHRRLPGHHPAVGMDAAFCKKEADPTGGVKISHQ